MDGPHPPPPVPAQPPVWGQAPVTAAQPPPSQPPTWGQPPAPAWSPPPRSSSSRTALVVALVLGVGALAVSALAVGAFLLLGVAEQEQGVALPTIELPAGGVEAPVPADAPADLGSVFRTPDPVLDVATDSYRTTLTVLEADDGDDCADAGLSAAVPAGCLRWAGGRLQGEGGVEVDAVLLTFAGALEAQQAEPALTGTTVDGGEMPVVETRVVALDRDPYVLVLTARSAAPAGPERDAAVDVALRATGLVAVDAVVAASFTD